MDDAILGEGGGEGEEGAGEGTEGVFVEDFNVAVFGGGDEVCLCVLLLHSD